MGIDGRSTAPSGLGAGEFRARDRQRLPETQIPFEEANPFSFLNYFVTLLPVCMCYELSQLSFWSGAKYPITLDKSFSHLEKYLLAC
jgi:hypothetical protein